VVGSVADRETLGALDPVATARDCELVEIRLDAVDAGPADWSHLTPLPLLFTARRGDEGGVGDLEPAERASRLRRALPDAALVDLELASLEELAELRAELAAAGLPWIASHHDFAGVPALDQLRAARERARHAGAAAFKAAVALGTDPGPLADLALFLRESPDFPIALMGMGPLAPVSRLLFAQLGSVLNYGYLGSHPTAPGQWSAARLRETLASLEPIP